MPDGTVNHAELEPGCSYVRCAGVSDDVIVRWADGDLIFGGGRVPGAGHRASGNEPPRYERSGPRRRQDSAWIAIAIGAVLGDGNFGRRADIGGLDSSCRPTPCGPSAFPPATVAAAWPCGLGDRASLAASASRRADRACRGWRRPAGSTSSPSTGGTAFAQWMMRDLAGGPGPDRRLHHAGRSATLLAGPLLVRSGQERGIRVTGLRCSGSTACRSCWGRKRCR